MLVRDETEDLGAAIRALTGGDGGDDVDIVFDGTGQTLFEISISALRYKGVFVHYGHAGGAIPPLSLGINLTGYAWSTAGAMSFMSRSMSGGGAHRR